VNFLYNSKDRDKDKFKLHTIIKQDISVYQLNVAYEGNQRFFDFQALRQPVPPRLPEHRSRDRGRDCPSTLRNQKSCTCSPCKPVWATSTHSKLSRNRGSVPHPACVGDS
jgi:hypothetical protein